MSSWTQEYAKAKGKAEEAAAAINERNRLLKTNQNTTTVTNTIRRLLAEITSDLMHLEDDLSQAESRNQITPQEADRQFDLIANLKQRFLLFLPTLLSRKISALLVKQKAGSLQCLCQKYRQLWGRCEVSAVFRPWRSGSKRPG
eukprot:m.29212 g.29212  ORF g.29212 m.29212 type:complete len:144 (-) comp40475_c0_seq1:386-817(-)